VTPILRIVRRWAVTLIACFIGTCIGIHAQYIKTYGMPLVATEYLSETGKVLATEVMFDPSHVIVATPGYTRLHQVLPTGDVKDWALPPLPPEAIAWLISVSRIHNTIRPEEDL